MHTLYSESLDRFRKHFQKPAPQTAFIERLAAHLEATSPVIEIRYVTHKGRKIEYVDYEPYEWDHNVVMRYLRQLFGDFQNGTVEFEKGAALDDFAQITKPTVAIEYVMRTNDAMYTSKGAGLAFGQDVTLKITLLIPADATMLTFSASGRTPPHFTASKDETYSKPSERAIEAAMNRIHQQFIPASPAKKN
jgi:hypothetical protein